MARECEGGAAEDSKQGNQVLDCARFHAVSKSLTETRDRGPLSQGARGVR